jgi:hypothetical protein
MLTPLVASQMVKRLVASGMLATLVAGLVIIVNAAPARAQASSPHASDYFYRGNAYGSDAAFHPVSEVINGTFGLLQITSNWVSLDDIHWRNGWDVTWQSITHPRRTVDAYGRSTFLSNEVLPGTRGWRNLQWVPNYSLHLIGGGARHRAFMEWYDAHGLAYPTAWAWATTAIHAFGVEMVGHHSEDGPTVDPVADMLIFDPLGALLFQSERVARFFSHTLHMSIWSGQPMYNPVLNSVENAGQNYGLHYFFRESHRVGLFSYWGMSHLLGVTVRESGFEWSVGLGGAVDELRADEQGDGMKAFYARLKFDAGLFLHRNGSLLMSVHASQAWTQFLRVNLYPGWISPGGHAMGAYTGVRGNDVIVGLTISGIPVGLSASQ